MKAVKVLYKNGKTETREFEEKWLAEAFAEAVIMADGEKVEAIYMLKNIYDTSLDARIK